MIIYADITLGCIEVETFLDAYGAMVEAPEYFLESLSLLTKPIVSELNDAQVEAIDDEYGIKRINLLRMG